MKRWASAGLLLLAYADGIAHGQAPQTGFLDRSVTVSGLRFKYQVYVPANYSERTNWPVILFLHGAGERGNEGLKQTAVGLAPAVRMNPERYPAIIIMPQVPTDSTWTGASATAAMTALDNTLQEFRTDRDRVYLTGLSMGGQGTWYLAYRYPDRFAAVVPICGWVSPTFAMRRADPVVPRDSVTHFEALARKLARVPIWIFHGEMDPAVPVEESRKAAAALKAAGGNVQYTEFLGTGHNSWDPAYGSAAFASWLFGQRRK
jgi:predicted peptidase